jgi:hypothetical protein
MRATAGVLNAVKLLPQERRHGYSCPRAPGRAEAGARGNRPGPCGRGRAAKGEIHYAEFLDKLLEEEGATGLPVPWRCVRSLPTSPSSRTMDGSASAFSAPSTNAGSGAGHPPLHHPRGDPSPGWDRPPQQLRMADAMTSRPGAGSAVRPHLWSRGRLPPAAGVSSQTALCHAPGRIPRSDAARR